MLEQQMQKVRDLPAGVGALESQVLQFCQEMREELSAIRSEIREGFGEVQRLMRVLHEDAISRIATMGEGKKRRGR